MCSIPGVDTERMFDRIERMSRTRVRRRRLAVTIAATLLAVAGLQGLTREAGAGVGSTAQRDRSRDRTYVVRPGDTVWRIAERVADPGADLRPLVHGIVDANRVDPGNLTAGQTLVIPAG
jgi:nucleoid-associated protein YgaU